MVYLKNRRKVTGRFSYFPRKSRKEAEWHDRYSLWYCPGIWQRCSWTVQHKACEWVKEGLQVCWSRHFTKTGHLISIFAKTNGWTRKRRRDIYAGKNHKNLRKRSNAMKKAKFRHECENQYIFGRCLMNMLQDFRKWLYGIRLKSLVPLIVYPHWIRCNKLPTWGIPLHTAHRSSRYETRKL